MRNVTFDHQNYYNAVQAALILKATEFAFRELGIPPDTGLKISVKKNNTNSAGIYCDDSKEISLLARKLDIQLLSTLFHEIVHMQQVMSGRLRSGAFGFSLEWRTNKNPSKGYYQSFSIVYVNNVCNSGDHEAYRQLPWEYDANHRSYKLLQKFVRANPYFKVCPMQMEDIRDALPRKVAKPF